jgi:hypothetical protein
MHEGVDDDDMVCWMLKDMRGWGLGCDPPGGHVQGRAKRLSGMSRRQSGRVERMEIPPRLQVERATGATSCPRMHLERITGGSRHRCSPDKICM